MKTMKKRLPEATTNPEIQKWEIEHAALARKAASEGMVLLKNENSILPLAKETKIALYGSGTVVTIKGGMGSGDVNERYCVSIREGLEKAGFTIANPEWCDGYQKLYDEKRQLWIDDMRDFSKKNPGEFFQYYADNVFERPVGECPTECQADVALYCISRNAGEGADRDAKKGDYYLNDGEREMLREVCKLYDNVIVVINAGGIIDLSFLDEEPSINAVLHISQPGMEGGNAVADVISGKVSPSGRLTDTWAIDYEDYPSSATFSHNNGNVDDDNYTEDIYVGYRYFDTFDVPYRYGFGYGISYSSFSVAATGLELGEDAKSFRVKADIKNVGKFEAKDVIQVYVSAPRTKLQKEFRRLVGFTKTHSLKNDRSTEIDVNIPVERLASFDESTHEWKLEKGIYIVWIGESLDDSKPVYGLEIKEDTVLSKVRAICPVKDEFDRLDLSEVEAKLEERYEKALKKVHENGKIVKFENLSIECSDLTKIAENEEIDDKEVLDIVEKLSIDQLCHMVKGDSDVQSGGNLGAAGDSMPGAAGETSAAALNEGVARIILADGPAGIRLQKYYYVKDGNIVDVPFLFNIEGGVLYPEAENLEGTRYYQYCTAIPVGTLLAQSFDLDLIKEVGDMIGDEMHRLGVTLWLAPGMNIHRNPLCGRNFEYYSEDPLLSGLMASAMTKGVQKHAGCGTTIKHFACNNQEDNRTEADSRVSERALREIYLKGFETAVKESQPLSIMTSYNLVNSVHTANSKDLITQLLRYEWGFEGLVMTDWFTTNSRRCSAAGCMRAGNDLIMPGTPGDDENLREELKNGTLEEKDVRACAERVIRTILQSEMYEEVE